MFQGSLMFCWDQREPSHAARREWEASAYVTLIVVTLAVAPRGLKTAGKGGKLGRVCRAVCCIAKACSRLSVLMSHSYCS